MKRIFYIILIALSWILISCNRNHCEVNESSILRNDSLINTIKSSVYFESIFEPKLDSLKYNCYRLIIHPSLGWMNEESNELERIIKIYKLEKKGDSIIYTIKFIDVYDNKNKVLKLEKQNMNYRNWKDFSQYLNNRCFWSMDITSPCNFTLDGIGISFEGYIVKKNRTTGRNYHCVFREASCDDIIFFEIIKKFRQLGNTQKGLGV